MKKILSPSILSINFLNIKNILKIINTHNLEYLHLDIMDGVFVPNISFGSQIVYNIREFFSKKIEVHLMTINPEKHIEIFKKNKIDSLIIHYEACNNLHKTINIIKKYGIKSGIAINPNTPINVLNNIICELDIITIMSVNPGFGGQKFIEKSYSKIKETKKLIEESGSKALIEVDGGINIKNIKDIISSGADILVIGNCIFSNSNNELISKKLKDMINLIKIINTGRGT